MWIDAAISAIAAKNIALGKGYGAVFYKDFVPFSPGITSGPAIILPASLMIALWGNSYWVPSVTALLLIDCLLIALFCQLRSILGSPAILWQSAALFLFSVMLITNHDIDNPQEKMLLWHALLGEIPSALLVIIGVLFISTHRNNRSGLLLGGIFLGLAGCCKLTALIAGVTVGAHLIAEYIMVRNRKEPTPEIATLLAYAGGVALPFLLFEAVKILILRNEHAYASTLTDLGHATYAFNHLPTIGVILGKFYVLGEYIGIAHMAPDAVGIKHILVQGTVVLVTWGFIKSSGFISRYITTNLRNEQTNLQWAISALLCCCLAHMIWWLFICSLTMPRYAFQGILYGCAALALYMGELSLRNVSKGSVLTMLVIGAVLCARYDAVAYFWTGMRDTGLFADEQQALYTLETMQKKTPDLQIFSCGDAFEMEYLLPTAGNFLPCDSLSAATIATHPSVLLSAYTANAYGMVNINAQSKTVGFIQASVWRNNPDSVRALCPRDNLYYGKNYFLAACHTF